MQLLSVNTDKKKANKRGMAKASPADSCSGMKSTEQVAFIRMQRDLALALDSVDSLNDGLTLCLDAALNVAGMDAGGVYLFDEKSGELNMVIQKGLSAEFVKEVCHLDAGSANARLVGRGKPVYSRHSELGLGLSDVRYREGLKAMAVIPINKKERCIGCMNLASHDVDVVPESARDAIETIVAQTGNAISRLRVEEQLREFEAKQQALISATNIGVIILDKAGCVLEANSEYVKLCGYLDRSEIIGRPVTDWTALYDIRRHGDEIMGCFKKGVVRHLEIDYLHKNGSVVPVEINAAVWRSGESEELVVWCRDVRARRNAQIALKESETRFRAMMEAMDDMVYICSKNYRVEYMNPAMIRRTGYDATGETCFQALYNRNEVCPWCNAGRVMKGASLKWEITSPKDSHVFSVSNTPFRHVDGSISKMAVIRDVTDVKKAEAERRKMELQMMHTQKLESLGVLAGGIAHDFNNLLTAMLGNIELAKCESPPDSPLLERLKAAETAAHRAADLCRQMLAYSGKCHFIVEPLDLNLLAGEMMEMIKVSISKKANLKFELAPGLPAIEADATQIRQILMNLVVNASESGDQGNVNISVVTGAMACDSGYLTSGLFDEPRAEGNYVFLEVSDTGYGIKKDDIKRIFDPFFSTKFVGRGLGLAAVLGIVRAHKGFIKVDSEFGRGTKIRVLFPSLGYVLAPARPAVAEDSSSWRGGGTVLLVDDELMVLAVGSRMLEHMGFGVLTAVNGLEALKVFKANQDRIACVLMDMTMPEMDGIDAFLKMQDIKNDVPVIITSGYGESVADDIKGKGVAGFIQKPFQLSILSKKLSEVIRR